MLEMQPGPLLHFGPFQPQQMLQHNPNCPEARIPVFQDLGMLTNFTIILQVSPQPNWHIPLQLRGLRKTRRSFSRSIIAWFRQGC